MSIRPAGRADLDSALAVIGRAFGLVVQSPSVHTLVAGAPAGGLLVAEREGTIVGTGAYVSFGRTGWLGGVAVDASARGQGLGRALTEAALEALGPHESVLLLASDAGRPIYERMGFEGEGAVPRLHVARRRRAGRIVPDAHAGRSRRGARSGRAGHGRTARAGDRRRRSRAASRHRTRSRCARPGRRAPILARDPAEGAALLAAVLEPGLRLAVPESNVAAVDRVGPARLRRAGGRPADAPRRAGGVAAHGVVGRVQLVLRLGSSTAETLPCTHRPATAEPSTLPPRAGHRRTAATRRRPPPRPGRPARGGRSAAARRRSAPSPPCTRRPAPRAGSRASRSSPARAGRSRRRPAPAPGTRCRRRRRVRCPRSSAGRGPRTRRRRRRPARGRAATPRCRP